jgi:DNA-binding NarL/FixJ family response regulator
VLVALCRPMLKAGNYYATPASNAAIAAELVLSVEAVKTHLRGVFERFEVGDLPQNAKRAKVAEIALRAGIVTERDL